MKRAHQKIPTTHVGSLARPHALHALIEAKEAGESVDDEELDRASRLAVRDVVVQQVAAGITVVNDGEQSKSSWAYYVKDRLNGLDGPLRPKAPTLEEREYPAYAVRRGYAPPRRTACVGPLSWRDFGAVQKDIDSLRAAVQDLEIDDVFMSASSPGNIANFHPNEHYPSQDAYLEALAELMRREYEAIAQAGFIVQLDCPDLALRHSWHPDTTVEEFRRIVAGNIEALDHATRNIPPDRLRMHVCWGHGEHPHTYDIPLRDIVDLLLRTRPAGISVVGANGWHEHEWKVWGEVRLPAGKVLIPGVIDNTTNIVEHPETVADRIIRYASVVGRDGVVAGVDCGFGNAPQGREVDPKIVWAKLASLGKGAALASDQLWKRGN